MGVATGFTAERMLAIEEASVVTGFVDVNGRLLLTTHGGTQIDAGTVVTASLDPIAIVSGNLDDITLPHLYSINTNALALSILNTPVDIQPGISAPFAGQLLVTKSQDARGIYQRYETYTNDVFTRSYHSTSGVWTAWKRLSSINATIATSANLNTYTAQGTYVQPTNANATLALNYPYASLAGLLEVFSSGEADPTHVWQRYTTYGGSGAASFVRSRYAASWSNWKVESSSLTPSQMRGSAQAITPSTANGAQLMSIAFAASSVKSRVDWTVMGHAGYPAAQGALCVVAAVSGGTIVHYSTPEQVPTAASTPIPISESGAFEIAAGASATLTFTASTTGTQGYFYRIANAWTRALVM